MDNNAVLMKLVRLRSTNGINEAITRNIIPITGRSFY